MIDKEPTIIEYASFFGSIQIFQYLFMNNVKLTDSVWLYGIHSNNSDLLRNYIEANSVKPENKMLREILKECIKCHHNDIARYIEDNLLDQNKKQSLYKQENKKNTEVVVKFSL